MNHKHSWREVYRYLIPQYAMIPLLVPLGLIGDDINNFEVRVSVCACGRVRGRLFVEDEYDYFILRSAYCWSLKKMILGGKLELIPIEADVLIN